MLKSASSFLVLSFIAIQVVVAKAIENGIYLIQDTNSGKFLGIGPVPHVYPLIDVPVRLFPEGDYFVERWNVKQANDGALVIASGRGRPDDYKIVAKGDTVIVSGQKAADEWAVTSVGDNKVEIQVPYNDAVFTADEEADPQITLQRAQGLPSQQFRFIRIDRELYHPYHRSRFNVQESC
ncbi:hypothetical protein BGZ82_011100 [Podila clonocystis]|nr:hypothetical protein BGZ82_011100 [Podila clonocystis]